jgi:hypothetical protein
MDCCLDVGCSVCSTLVIASSFFCMSQQHRIHNTVIIIIYMLLHIFVMVYNMKLLIIFLGIQGPRCILAGDHLQLPPTIQSVDAEKKGMRRTLFQRLTEAYGEEITSMLTIQYRMRKLIMNWSSKELYNNKVHLSTCVIVLCV